MLDLKWSGRPHGDRALLGAVVSTGSLCIYSLSNNGNFESHESAAAEGAPLLLSLDWADRLGRADDRIVTTSSAGEVSIWRLANGGLSLETNWTGHDLECWVAAFASDSSDIVYSGADDCVFKSWDLRCGTDTPVAFNRRSHSMGVTTIQASPHRANTLVTGSYDEHVRVWDTRSLARPVSETRTPGGGVWRIKHRPDRDNELLVAAMHSGAFVLRAEDGGAYEVARHYTEHTSLGYGADWHPSRHGLVATCSFYDHSLHLWNV